MLVVNHLVISMDILEEQPEGGEVKNPEEFAENLVHFISDELAMVGATLIYNIEEQDQHIIPCGKVVIR